MSCTHVYVLSAVQPVLSFYCASSPFSFEKSKEIKVNTFNICQCSTLYTHLLILSTEDVKFMLKTPLKKTYNELSIELLYMCQNVFDIFCKFYVFIRGQQEKV